MLTRLAAFAVARRRFILVAAVVFLALAGSIGGTVAQELSGAGFTDPASQSQRAEATLERQFHTGPSNLLLLVRSTQGVDAVDRQGLALTKRLAREPGVTDVVSYWSAGHPVRLKSRDGRAGLVLARVAGNPDDGVKRVKELAARYNGTADGLQTTVGGQYETFSEVGATIKHDVLRAESIAIPVTGILLVLVFGSAIAAALPLLIGVLSILGTFLTLHLVNGVTDVSVYSVNLATSLGLGLGIDYALFMVTRFREELATDLTVPAALAMTLRTAGRTVLFSALTVLLSLSAMLVFPLFFLKSFAYAGIAAVIFAVVGALVVLPAALAVLGHRVDTFDLRKPLRRLLGWSPPRVKALDEGFWHRVAVLVMRRPLGVGTAVVAILIVAGLPFRSVAFGLPDDRVLPRGAQAHQVAQAIRDDFAGREAAALPIVLPAAPGAADVAAYARALSQVSGVERVDASDGSWVTGQRIGSRQPGFTAGGGARLSVVPAVESIGPRGERLVSDLRAVPAPAPVLMGGPAASLVDTKAALGGQLPLAIGLVLLATFLLLFLFTGSIVLPVKALVLNLLSLSATFGVMVFVFQQGHLTSLIGDPIVTGTLDTSMPILMFCVLFGLSMDYEVFLLSRIKEEWDAHGDNTRAVAAGLERTGKLVTAAAALLALVFLSFTTSSISFIKLLGLGTALAVLVDATLVRGILVPAFMRLAGRANWWAPAPLRRLHARFGLSEEGAVVPAPRPVRSSHPVPATVSREDEARSIDGVSQRQPAWSPTLDR